MKGPQFQDEFPRFAPHWLRWWKTYDAACTELHEFFQGRPERRLDLDIAPDLLRYFARTRLRREGSMYDGLFTETLARNGLAFRSKGRRVRVWKEPFQGRTFPITSEAKRDFFRGKHPPHPLWPDEEPIDWNLVILVRVNAAYQFQGFWLGLPADVDRKNMPVYYWLEPVNFDMVSQFVPVAPPTVPLIPVEGSDDLPFQFAENIADAVEEELGAEDDDEEQAE